MALRKIDIRECHRELAKIAEAFDRLCEAHGIPYFMLGGTMLGAVRHKGFIPWDDDMDFGIPRPFFGRFVRIAREELPAGMSVLTPENSPAMKKGFVKIGLKGSRLIERVFGKEETDFFNGIAIDVFPLDGADTGSWRGRAHIRIAFLLQRIYEVRYCSLEIRKGFKKAAAAAVKMLPFDDRRLGRFINRWIQKKEYATAGKVVNFCGVYGMKEVTDKSIFSRSRLYPFEQIRLRGVADYHTFLSNLYGDYMRLPPPEQQRNHADAIYVEDGE